jgi:uncharacterized membrane protein
MVEKMLVVVFDDETKAYEGSSTLKQLDSEGSVSVHAESVVKKNADGSIAIKEMGDDFPVRTAGGTAVGALIGILGGPVGFGVGAATGALIGYVADMDRAGVNTDFLSDVSNRLTPGKWALVSDISEEWETPVDTGMEKLGGVVFRATREDVEEVQNARDQAELNAEINRLKEEQAQAREQDKGKIQKKIDALKGKLATKMQQAKEHSDRNKAETETKLHALEEKLKKAQGDAKAKIEARIASFRKKSATSEQAGMTAPQMQK